MKDGGGGRWREVYCQPLEVLLLILSQSKMQQTLSSASNVEASDAADSLRAVLLHDLTQENSRSKWIESPNRCMKIPL